jgi:hypothetical protein
MIEFNTIADVISAVNQGEWVCWKTGAYQLKKDKSGKWFVFCCITNDWAPLFWSDGVTSHYKAEDFFIL